MEATIERADELIDEASIRDGRAIVRFSRTEAALADLRGRFERVQFDLTTTAGDTAARQARRELVSLRTGLDKRRKELKLPAVEFGRKIDSEASRLTAEIVALEEPIDLQIKADEQRRAEEREARIRAEEERQATLRQRITDISNVAVRAAGMSSGEIAEKIALVSRIALGDDFEEFVAAAINTKAETLVKLQELHEAALKAEEQAAENERNRIRLAELEAADVERRKREAAEADARREAEQKAAMKRQAQGDTARRLADEIRVIQRRAVASSSTGMLELVTLIEAIQIGDELGDFAVMAQKAKDDALADLHAMHGQKMQAENEVRRQRAELEAARRQVEDERAAARAARREQEAAAESVLRWKIEYMAPQAGPAGDGSQKPDDGAVIHAAEAGSDAQESAFAGDARRCTETVAEAAQPTVVGDEGTAVHADERTDEPATVSTGEIGKRLGFALRQDFIEGTLGVMHAGTDKRATLWRESQWAEIKAALVEHIRSLD